ncbi:unnamed protein product [Ceratitis capitata]|uniref:(Mediterranean fruit fly) hypothetical protein n=1 Tax=Ceratitis capitata TaxID=7213 RepID=A0A811U625_CERCA|nr:unnamed protein product [Ceratitis capitata]
MTKIPKFIYMSKCLFVYMFMVLPINFKTIPVAKCQHTYVHTHLVKRVDKAVKRSWQLDDRSAAAGRKAVTKSVPSIFVYLFVHLFPFRPAHLVFHFMLNARLRDFMPLFIDYLALPELALRLLLLLYALDRVVLAVGRQ